MKTRLNFFILLAISMTLLNCSKDDDNNRIQEEQATSRVSSFYTDISTFDITYNQNNNIETMQVPGGSMQTLTYNANNKITSIGDENYQYNDSNNVVAITTENTDATIAYNPQGKIMLISTSKVNTDSSMSHSTANFTYNAEGLVDQVIETNTNFPTLTYRNRYTYDSNYNLIQRLEEETTDGTNYTLTRTLSLTYDDKKSPYFKINNTLNEYSNISVYNLWNFHSYRLTRRSFQHVSHYSQNNYTIINKVTSAGDTTVFNFDNTYNDEDYLTLMDRTVTSPTGTESYAIYGFNYETY